MIIRQAPREPKKVSSQSLLVCLEEMGFSTSLRTIQRDLQGLSTIFSIIEIKGTGRGNEGCGWAFEKNATLGIPLMDPSAALTFKLANQYLQQVMPKDALQYIQPYLDEADSVLRGFNKRGYRSWPDKVSVYTRSDFLKPAELDADTTAIIYEALLDNKRFVACYKDKPNQVISPLGMVARGSTIYLICTFNDYEDKLKWFNLNRHLVKRENSVSEVINEYSKKT